MEVVLLLVLLLLLRLVVVVAVLLLLLVVPVVVGLLPHLLAAAVAAPQQVPQQARGQNLRLQQLRRWPQHLPGWVPLLRLYCLFVEELGEVPGKEPGAWGLPAPCSLLQLQLHLPLEPLLHLVAQHRAEQGPAAGRGHLQHLHSGLFRAARCWWVQFWLALQAPCLGVAALQQGCPCGCG